MKKRNQFDDWNIGVFKKVRGPSRIINKGNVRNLITMRLANSIHYDINSPRAMIITALSKVV